MNYDKEINWPQPQPIIIVKFKDVYGNRLVYPVCDNAQHFAAIAGTKTLSSPTLAHIKAIGFDIEIEQETL
jgi:hypothetical protein